MPEVCDVDRSHRGRRASGCWRHSGRSRDAAYSCRARSRRRPADRRRRSMRSLWPPTRFPTIRRRPASSARCRPRLRARKTRSPDIARRFNLGYDEVVNANPGVDPWLPGAGRAHRIADAVRAARRAARRHRREPRRTASLLLSEGREERAAAGHDLSDRHRHGRLGDADRHHENRVQAQGSVLDAARVGAQGTRRRRRHPAARACRRAPTIRSAPLR